MNTAQKALSSFEWQEVAEVPVLSPGASSSAGTVIDTRYRPLDRSVPVWAREVAEKIRCALRESGDRFPQAYERAEGADRLLSILLDSAWSRAPRPMISSTETGGLAAEFRGPRVEVQVEVEPKGEISVYLLDRGQFEWEGPLDSAPDGLEKWAWRLGHDF